MRAARSVVAAILRDLQGRSGLRQAWESIDEETQRDIREEWEQLAGVSDDADEDAGLRSAATKVWLSDDVYSLLTRAVEALEAMPREQR